ncbi:hypothetical protein REPUB_Repub07fG0110900 [Reevesia pubescens]
MVVGMLLWNLTRYWLFKKFYNLSMITSLFIMPSLLVKNYFNWNENANWFTSIERLILMLIF